MEVQTLPLSLFMLYETIIKENEAKVRATILTDQEKEDAYYEGQKKKYFKLKHGHLWNVHTAELSRSKQTDIAPRTTMP